VTTTTIGTSSATVTYGDAVTFTAAIAPAGLVAMATGTVSFEIDGTSIGSVAIANGSAALVTSALAAGSHSVVAKYSGDSNFTSSASGGLSQTVTRARTEVSADLFSNRPVAGQLQVKVAVKVADRPSLTAIGNVTLSENGGMLAQDSLNGGGAALYTPELPAGHHQLLVSYAGDSNFEPSSVSIGYTALVPQLSISSIAVTEGNAGSQIVQLLVQLSEPSSQIVRVAFTTIDGSARAGQDYELSGGMLEFPPGEISRLVEVHVFGDTTPEPDQSFAVVLSDPANADIGNGIGTITIINDDGPVTGNPRGRPSRH
jgi:Bacterial Ig-like domain (group 3)/Calx-beta domain